MQSTGKPVASRKERSNEARAHAPVRHNLREQPRVTGDSPAAGAHAAPHLINEDATPGAGALPGYASFGKEVDGGAG